MPASCAVNVLFLLRATVQRFRDLNQGTAFVADIVRTSSGGLLPLYTKPQSRWTD
jgi:hypothetical protein